MGKSHLTKNTNDKHPERKSVVLDGRLRSTFNDKNRNPSMFFMITRTENAEEANLRALRRASDVKGSFRSSFGIAMRILKDPLQRGQRGHLFNGRTLFKR